MQINGARTAGLVLECLDAARRPLKAYEILAAIRPRGVNSAMTVYRALGRLRAVGRVRRIESLNAFLAVPAGKETASPEKTLGVAICDRCGTVSPFWDEALASVAARDVSLFDVRSLTLELHGFCGNCRPPPG